MAPRKLSLEDYEITAQGQVINKTNGHALKGQPNAKGYLRVSIGGKLMFIHRLVAEKYIPNPDNKEQINHINGDKTDNRAENLEWVSNQENRNHAVKEKLHLQGEDCKQSKLDWEKVNYIREHPEVTIKYFSELYSVSRSTISDVRHYRTWKINN